MPSASPLQPNPLRYNPALDGVRSIAVLSVLAVHLGLIELNFLGVDLLFTLSGFLVTTLMLTELHRTGSVWIGGFLWRRAIRLLPAFYVFLLSGLAFSLLQKPASRETFLYNALTSIFYVNNIYRMSFHHAGVWLGHVWSLSVEQQFYLIWPFCLLWLARKDRERLPLRLVCIALFFTGWRLALLWMGAPPLRFYFGIDTRADELLLGCAAGAWHHVGYAPLWGARSGSPSKLLKPLVKCGPVAFALMMMIPLIAGDPTETNYWLGWPRFFAAALLSLTVVISLERSAPWSKPFTWPPMVSLGKVSYGFYLWHYPVAAVLGLRIGARFGGAAALIASALITASLAYLSQRVIEAPAQREGRRLLTRRRPASGQPDSLLRDGGHGAVAVEQGQH